MALNIMPAHYKDAADSTAGVCLQKFLRTRATPRFYSVELDRFGIHVELTATLYTSLYQFTFPATDKAHLLLSLDRAADHVEVVSDHTLRGMVDPVLIAVRTVLPTALISQPTSPSLPFLWQVSPDCAGQGRA